MSADKVGVIIATNGKLTMLKSAIRGLLRGAGEIPLDIVLVEHNSKDVAPAIAKDYPQVRTFQVEDTAEEKWSFSTLNNYGAKQTDTPYLLLMNNDVIPKPGMLPEMLSVLTSKADVGLVGAKLLFPQGTIQHVGVIFYETGVPMHLGYGKPDNASFPAAGRSDYYDAVTFACVLIRRNLWDTLDGLSPKYFFNYDDVDFCLRAREAGWRCYLPHKAVALHLESQSQDLRRSYDHSLVRNLAVFRDDWITTGRLQKIVGTKVAAASTRFESQNIAFVPLGPDSGVGWWRIENIARLIAEKGLANAEVIYGNSSETKLMAAVEQADLMVWQGHFDESLKRIAAGGSLRSFRMIYEYDDHPIYLSPFAQAYRTLGTKEFFLQPQDGSEGKWLWRDGESGFDLERNRQGRQNQLEIMASCDALTTTTPALAEFFSTLNKHVFVLPNCIDFRFYAAPSDRYERRPGPVRIGWWGGDNHWHDWASIGPWMVDFVNKHDVKLVLLGSYYSGPLKGIDPNKVEALGWVKVDAFPWRLAAAAIDVAVIPLASPTIPDFRFNNYKSDIKFLEASALKWPSLVQGAVRPYEACEDGVNALSYLTETDFKEKLEALVKDPQFRRNLAHRAYEWVRENRDLEKNIEKWVTAYTAVLAKPEPDKEAEEIISAADSVPESELRPAGSGAVAVEAAPA